VHGSAILRSPLHLGSFADGIHPEAGLGPCSQMRAEETRLGGRRLLEFFAREVQQAEMTSVDLRPFLGVSQLFVGLARHGGSAGAISQEVVQRLVSVMGSDVRVTLEIWAEAPRGIPEKVERDVSRIAPRLNSESTISFASNPHPREKRPAEVHSGWVCVFDLGGGREGAGLVRVARSPTILRLQGRAPRYSGRSVLR
jgi:hypothetical protein